MSNPFPARLARFRARPLTAGLAAAFITSSMMTAPVFAANTWYVTSCLDDGIGDTLRSVVNNPGVKSGDFVDLSLLPVACGLKDSVITLQQGDLQIHRDDLTLKGPEPGNGSVTIDGAHIHRTLFHLGVGTLTVENLTLANGEGSYAGGCIRSFGDVSVIRSVVTNCSASGSDPDAFRGGGIYASGNVGLSRSTISGNTIIKKQVDATVSRGGGVFAHGNLFATYSTIRDNHVVTPIGGHGNGGGIYADSGNVSLNRSTIENNSATGNGGGIALGLSPGVHHYITTSTISNNTAIKGGGINLTGYGVLEVFNSTIAFNHATYSEAGFGGLAGCYGCSLTLQSSIVANNTDGAFNAPSDLYMDPAKLLGSHNLILSTNVFALPAGFIAVSSDPKLGPLQFNGGPTRTHGLLPGSPALAMGKTFNVYTFDQRGLGYPRTSGPGAAVDIGSLESDYIFVDGVEKLN